MKRNSHARGQFIALILIALAAISIGVTYGQSDQPSFVVGVLDLPDGSITRGARLAVREINESGGVLGADGTFFRLELHVESVEAGEILTQAVNNLANENVIAVLGPASTESVLSNLPILQSLDVPILTPAIGDTVVASDTTGAIVRIRAAERWLGSALADHIVQTLQFSAITTVQLDRTSTAARVGFSIALDQLAGGPTETSLLLEDQTELVNLANQIAQSGTPAVVAFGEPDITVDFLSQLRSNGWIGAFVYHRAGERAFRACADPDLCRGVLGAATWSLSATDAESDTFLNNFVRAFGETPGPIEAATYDGVRLLATAIGRSGALKDNLSSLDETSGVQGILNVDGLAARETTNATMIIAVNALGGVDLVARYAGARAVDAVELPTVIASTPTPVPTATPDGVYLTIESNRQNVRTGPGIGYDILGQLQQGETARVIGATIDFSWVVIEFRGQQGFLATYLLDVIGDRAQVPVIAPPPTPTPPPATATPTAPPIADIQVIAVSPNNITQGELTNVNVTVRNAGSVNAGPFAIAASFPPDNVFAAFNVAGLAAGADLIIPLPITLAGGTGNYNATIVADLNGQLAEGVAGEANNDDFIFNYKVDRQLTLINSVTLTTGTALDLEGNVAPINDVIYTGGGLDTTSPCAGATSCVGVLNPGANWDTSHYDLISGVNGVNSGSISNGSLSQPGATIGVLTTEGRRAVIRVDSFNPGVSVTITYRVYQ